MDAIRMYFRYAGACFASQMQDRASFFLQTVAGFFVNGVEFLAIALLFQRFGGAGGWTLPELALGYGLVHTAFAIADGTAGGFDLAGSLIQSGDFDRLLVRPRSTLLQVAGQGLQVRRAGRFLQGLAAFAWGVAHAGVAWTPAKVALLVAAEAGGVFLFYGVFILQGALVFLTIEPLEMVNVMTYGGVELAQYPISIYRPAFRAFCFIVPVAAVNYLPLIAVLERVDPLGTPAWLHWSAPLAGPLFFTAARRAWRAAERRYTSAGS